MFERIPPAVAARFRAANVRLPLVEPLGSGFDPQWWAKEADFMH